MAAAAWTISIIAIATAMVLAVRWELDSRAPTGRNGSDEGTVRHEFMSPLWIDMARRTITESLATADLDVEPFTLSEEFTHPPAHLRADGEGETIGFSICVGDGRVHVADAPAQHADLRVITDYGDALALARDPDAAAADPAEAERRVAEGRLRMEGDPSRAPAALLRLDLHRLLAAHTA